MTKPVILRAQADADIDSAADHYLREAPEVVDALLDSLEATLADIGRSPGRGSPRYAHLLDLPGLRFRMTKRFPYLVFYVEGPREIAVLRVLHQHRDIPQEFEPQ
jgi:toxin ParE1/3/4